MERVAVDRQRIVDADDLVRDLLAVLVHGEVRREVRGVAGVEARGLELEVAHQQQARRADRLHGQRLALGHDQPLLVAQPRGHRRGDEEHDEARVGEQRGHLRPAVAIAVEVRRAGRGLAPDDEPVAAQDPRRRVGVDAREDRPVRERGVVVGVGLDDPDVRRLAPESRQPVDRARDDRQDQAPRARR